MTTRNPAWLPFQTSTCGDPQSLSLRNKVQTHWGSRVRWADLRLGSMWALFLHPQYLPGPGQASVLIYAAGHRLLCVCFRNLSEDPLLPTCLLLCCREKESSHAGGECLSPVKGQVLSKRNLWFSRSQKFYFSLPLPFPLSPSSSLPL